MDELLGIPEIADRLGISKQYLYRLMSEDPRSPKPIASLAAGRIWQRRAIERWAARIGRQYKDPTESAA